MNSTGENLFVKRNTKTKSRSCGGIEYKYKRNIKTVSQINENLLLVGVTGKISYDKMLERDETLHTELKPLLIMLRLLGCFPVSFSKSDVPRYRAFSPAFIYSVCLYVLINIISFLSVRNGVLHLFKKDDSIGDSVFNSLLLISLVNCTGFPVLAWLDTPKFVQYLHKWEEFQTMFLMVTGDRAILSTRRHAIYSLVCMCAMAPITLTLHVFPPQLQYWQVSCYSVSLLVMVTTMSIFSIMFRSLLTVATLLNKCFKRDVKQMNFSPHLIGKYRILWLRWSQLVSQIGCMMGKVFSLHLVLLLVIIIVSLYTSLSVMNRKTVNAWGEFLLNFFCLLCAAVLYHFCDYAHELSNMVGVEIRDELQLIAPPEVRDDVSQEVNMFLETMVMHPPVVSVSGFAKVDRGLFRACASTIVTYMIVLVQFDQSDRSHYKSNRNTTP